MYHYVFNYFDYIMEKITINYLKHLTDRHNMALTVNKIKNEHKRMNSLNTTDHVNDLGCHLSVCIVDDYKLTIYTKNKERLKESLFL